MIFPLFSCPLFSGSVIYSTQFVESFDSTLYIIWCYFYMTSNFYMFATVVFNIVVHFNNFGSYSFFLNKVVYKVKSGYKGTQRTQPSEPLYPMKKGIKNSRKYDAFRVKSRRSTTIYRAPDVPQSNNFF